MKLQNRIELLLRLGEYLKENTAEWQDVKSTASVTNGWFVPEFIELAVNNIADHFLQENNLKAWINHYHIDDNIEPKNVGVVMAGNIPLVGFHDIVLK